MKIISRKPERPEIFLANEIIYQIVLHISEDEDERQVSLYACCLVSRQWYFAAVPFLYERPRLHAGKAFERFIKTVCPSVGAPKRQKTLGSLVHCLNMRLMIHQSSNSTTARLLNRVKENLEVLVVPVTSFSVNCLSPLSKCINLRYLDLFLTRHDMPIANLMKALGKLHQLVYLRLPRSFRFEHEDPVKRQNYFEEDIWPPRLRHIQFSGFFMEPMNVFSEVGFLKSFHWPSALTRLTIDSSLDFESYGIYLMLHNSKLFKSLRSLTIYSLDDSCSSPLWSSGIVPSLPRLRFLSLHGHVLNTLFFSAIANNPPYNNTHNSGLSYESLASSSSETRVDQVEPYSLEVLEYEACFNLRNGPATSIKSLYADIVPQMISTANINNGPRPRLAMLRAIGIHNSITDANSSDMLFITTLDLELQKMNQLRKESEDSGFAAFPVKTATSANTSTDRIGSLDTNLSTIPSVPTPSLPFRPTKPADQEKYSEGETTFNATEKLERELRQALTNSHLYAVSKNAKDNVEREYRSKYHTIDGVEDSGTDDGGYVGVYFIGGFDRKTKRFGKGNRCW